MAIMTGHIKSVIPIIRHKIDIITHAEVIVTIIDFFISLNQTATSDINAEISE